MVCSGRRRYLLHSGLHDILLRLPIWSVAKGSFQWDDASISNPASASESCDLLVYYQNAGDMNLYVNDY